MSLQRRLLLTLLAMLLVMAALFTAFWLVMRFQVLPHLEAHFRAVLRNAASRYELGSRAEFEVQAKLLALAREQLAASEARLAALEQRIAALEARGA